jgi:acylphosphatase
VRKRVVVQGRVQGVWFRASLAREAERLGVAGFARNQRDGSVLVELEGPARVVEELVQWCHVGPPRAEVTHVAVEDVPPTGQRGFRAE